MRVDPRRKLPRRHSRLAVSVFAITVAVVAGGATGAGASPAATGTAGRRIVVPIAVQGGPGTPKGARPTVIVRVGTSAPVRVLLDTGSTGLQILAPLVQTPSDHGVRSTDRPDRIRYAGGHTLTGVIATAKITIGSQATARPVAFGLVQETSCAPTKPACPTAGGIQSAIARGFTGILGVGVNRGPGGITSPILGMPGRLGHTWSIHLRGTTGSLALGAGVPRASRSRVSIPLTSRGRSGSSPLWANNVRLCVGVGSTRGCRPALIDSGTFSFQLPAVGFQAAPVAPGTNLIAVGTPVTVSRSGHAPFWTFMTGTARSADLVTRRAGNRGLINTGVQAFYAFTITYDLQHGSIHLVPTS